MYALIFFMEQCPETLGWSLTTFDMVYLGMTIIAACYLRWFWVVAILMFVLLLMLRSEYIYKKIVTISRDQAENILKKQKRYLGYLLFMKSLQDYNVFESTWWHKHGKKVMLAATGFTISLGIWKMSKGLKKSYKSASIDMESTSKFYITSPFNEVINKMEEDLGCGVSWKKVPNKTHAQWNIQNIVTKSCPHTGTPKQLYDSILKNVRNVRVHSGNGNDKIGFVLGLCSNYAVMNTHTLGEEKSPIIMVSCTGSIGESNTVYKNTKLDETNRLDLGKDLTIVALSSIKFKDITMHLTDDDLVIEEYPGYIGNDHTWATLIKNSNFPLVLGNNKKITVPDLWTYDFSGHYPGFCGAPLVIQKNNSCCIGGIHVGARGAECFASPIWKSNLLNGIEKLKTKEIYFPLASAGDITVENLEEPSIHSPFRYEVLHGVDYYGKIPGRVEVNQKSSLVRSEYYQTVVKMLETHLMVKQVEHYTKPLMKPIIKDDIYLSPYNIALKNISSQKACLDPQIMKKVIKVLSKKIIDGLKKAGIKKLEPLTMEAAINGAMEDPFIKRINAHTAAGFGYPGCKEKYIPIVHEEDSNIIREPIEDLKKRLVECMERYDQGLTNNFIYKAQLKDEPRKLKKALAGETRVFFGSALEALILNRMYTSTFYSLMVQFRDIFCTSVGIDMHSGAGELIEKLKEFSKKLMEGDYGTYDQKPPFDAKRAASTVIYIVLKEFGYNGKALKHLCGILTDNLFPWVEMLKDLFEAAGMQPSGRYATAEDNSLLGVILLMYAWYAHKKLNNKDFFKFVLPDTYGDDMLAAVKECVSQFFNNLYYQMFCRKVYLMDFTSPDKTSEMPDFTNVDKCSFLKRKFRYREDIKMWVAVLDPDSLMRSVTWYIPSTNVPVHEQQKGTITSLMWELALYLSREKYFEFKCAMEKLLSLTYMGGKIVNLPDFDHIIEEIRQ